MGEEEEALRGAATIRNGNDYVRTTTTNDTHRSSSGYDEQNIPNSYYGNHTQQHGGVNRHGNHTQQHGGVNMHESTERESQFEKKKMYEEGMLLRETIYALQGIDGSRVKFLMNSTNNDNNNHQATVLSVEEEGLRIYPRLFRNHGGMLDAIKLIGECGWCYKTIQRTIDEISNSTTTTTTTLGNHTNGGMVARALAASLSEELIEYHRLIAILESQVDSSTSINRINTSRSSLTFKRLLVWIRPAFHRLKILSTLIDGIYPFINSSGSLCSAIHQHTLHIQLGMNDNHGQMMHRISNKSMVPLFEFIFRWVFYGHLASSNKEDFFIVENKSVSDAMLWAENGRYALQHCHVPCFLNNSSGGGGGSANNLANVILNVGKAVNFMNKCFPNNHNHNSHHHHGGGNWDLLTHFLQVQNPNNHRHHERTQHTTPTFTSLAAKLGFSYTHYKTLLPHTISHASTLMHSHIVSQLMNTDQHQYSLFENLHALKSFLLLSQGDFLQSLMDGLGPLLDNNNNNEHKHSNLLLHKHTIHNIVENALRNTNAKHFSDVILSKVRVRMLTPKHHHTSDQNNSNWDVFSLDYDISPPLTAIVHPQCQFQYRKMFTLLWRLKKLEWNLNRTWRQATFIHHAIMARSRHFHRRRDMGGLDDDDDDHDDGRSSKENQRWNRYALAIRKSASTRHAILHLVGNLQSYLMHEVIEGSWKVLMQKLSNSKVCLTLDDVIHAHEHYLDTIVSKSMLFNATSTDDDHTNEAGASGGGVASQLSLVLDTASRFVTVQQHLFTDVLHNLQQAAERRREAERRIENGEWGYETAEPQNEDIIGDWDHNNISDDPETEQVKKTRLEAVHTTSKEFDMAIRTFLTMLNDCSEGGGSDQDVSSSYSSPTTTTNSNSTLEENGGRSTTTTTTTSSQQRLYQNDDALRFLTFRLDFNQYYSIVR